ncbi:hypothetical protein [Vibrio vulnificus]|uniref:hypothetical protein n=1 Tax=Vibrio vulnificus TaxID=672 RepID=UPI001EEC72F0|nr:hypothetical protein [Vibrio vulnificus]MCG6291502.1 hypothetical protein [Vibrio vulnificus]
MKQVLTTLSLAVTAALLAGCNASSKIDTPPTANAYRCDAVSMNKADDLRIYQVTLQTLLPTPTTKIGPREPAMPPPILKAPSKWPTRPA